MEITNVSVLAVLPQRKKEKKKLIVSSPYEGVAHHGG